MAMAKSGSRATDAAVGAAVLNELLKRRGPVALTEAARRLGVPVARVRREMQGLAEAGCQFVEHAPSGVVLVKTGLSVWEDYLRWRLKAPRGERMIQVYRQTASTQDVGRRIAAHGGAQADGALIVADYQRAGRGRLGRKWYAPAGTCVLFSLVHAPRRTCGAAFSADRLVLATSVALARGLEVAAAPAPLEVQIKWPNDLVVGGRKIGGILVETVDAEGPRAKDPGGGTPLAVIGVGLNVSLDIGALPAGVVDEPNAVTSLVHQGVEVDRLLVLAEAVTAMEAALGQEDLNPLLDAWRQRSVLLGQRVSARCGGRTFRGEVMDLDPLDGLVLRTAGGEMVHLSAQTTALG